MLDGKVQVLGERMDVLEENVRVLDGKVQVLGERMDTLDDKVRVLDENVRTMKEDIHVLSNRMDKVEDKVHVTNIILENDVTVRLQNIEECYTSTYKRYQEGVEDLDMLKSDMGVVKQVVSKHSEILKRIS